MKIDPAFIIYIAMMGALSILILPLASKIPDRLHQQWNHDAYETMQSRNLETAPISYDFSLWQKVAFVFCACMLGAAISARYQNQTQCIALAFYFLCLLLLVIINLKHTLLPDAVVYCNLWVGLIFYAQLDSNVADHVLGAAGGYLLPYIFMMLIKIRTGKEAIARGDMKAMAMAGAWFGLSLLPALIISYTVGIIGSAFVAAYLRKTGKMQSRLVASGPAHLLASLAAAFGPSLA